MMNDNFMKPIIDNYGMQAILVNLIEVLKTLPPTQYVKDLQTDLEATLERYMSRHKLKV